MRDGFIGMEDISVRILALICFKQVSGFRYQVSGIRFQVSGGRFQVGMRNQYECIAENLSGLRIAKLEFQALLYITGQHIC